MRYLKGLLFFSFLILWSCNEKKDHPIEGIHTIHENIATIPNLVYKTIDSLDLELDVYVPVLKLGEEPWDVLSGQLRPTLIYFHGGGWVGGERSSRLLGLLPYLEKGWCVVNVDYSLLDKTNLIGCLDDCNDAVHWVLENSPKYKFDPDRIYLSGESAGGHLALLTGMMDKGTRKNILTNPKDYNIAGIINWYGITDIRQAIKFWNDPSYTEMISDKWEGDLETYYDLTSPINHISKHTPPILSVHGDADVNVAIEQSIALHKRLDDAKIKNRLIKVPGKKHGNFSAWELASIFDGIWSFIGFRGNFNNSK